MSDAARVSAQLTSFIGRSRELTELGTLFDRARLITLTGPGGSGKTRLALEFAARLPGGAGSVDLAPVTDAGLIPGAIAGVLGIRETDGRVRISATRGRSTRPFQTRSMTSKTCHPGRVRRRDVNG